MKLLAELQKQVGSMGTLRYAWFTSFNTDIEFVETYILPTALKTERPRNRLDYEQLQQELTQKDIDFRVFCDPRFLEANRIKRTCIPVHGVRPERLAQRFSGTSLFHPKVIYLEDFSGKRVIGAGSANLTLSGWGRNLEAFQFFEVTTYKNYREIRRFFQQLCLAADIPCELNERGKFVSEQANWRFVHSYQDEPLANQLLTDAKNKDLVVWSPYLPRDLAGFIAKLQSSTGAAGLRVHVVPDRIEGKYLRTEWTEELSRMTTDGRLTFYDSPLNRDQKIELCHTKLWKISGKLAIGSWNFTRPGSNILNDDGEWSLDDNVEAGFIIDDRNDWKEAYGKLLNVGSGDCASSDVLEKEGLVVDPLPPFDLHVSFDWHTQTYAFNGKWLGDGPRDDYSVRLPGVAVKVPLVWNRLRRPVQPSQLTIDDRELLRDRVFHVYLGDKEIYRALVSELNAKSRRAQSFGTLQDLLEASLQDDDPNSLPDLPFRIPLNDDALSDTNVLPLDPDAPEVGDTLQRGGITHFRLFQSMLAYEKKLSKLDKLEQLEGHIFFSPGCLRELVDKTRAEIQKPEREVFNWFLANEVRSLCQVAHRRRQELVRDAKKRGYVAVPEERWKELSFELPEPPAGVPLSYSELVRKQCNYG